MALSKEARLAGQLAEMRVEYYAGTPLHALKAQYPDHADALHMLEKEVSAPAPKEKRASGPTSVVRPPKRVSISRPEIL